MRSSGPPHEPGSRRPDPSVPGGADRYEALLQVLEHQAKQAEEEKRPPPKQRRPFRLILLAVLIGITAWLWIAPPAWLIPPPPPPQPVEQEEAALRFAMYLQAQRIRAHQLEHGSLPETLEEAGQPMPGMRYYVLGTDLYELTGTSDRVRLTYRSDEPLSEWMGPGAGVGAGPTRP